MQQKQLNIKKYLFLSIIGSILIILSSTRANALASTTNYENISQNVSQSYNATTPLPLGTIVQPSVHNASTVIAAQSSNILSIIGVVVSPKLSTATLTPQNSTAGSSQVYVATAGRYDVLVSNQNGPINSGNYITLSSLKGIGMKATALQPIVVGTALANFNGQQNVIKKMSIQSSSGQHRLVSIGSIMVNIHIIHNPLIINQTAYVPKILSTAATAVANKSVSAIKIYLGVIILLSSAVITGSMLYAGIKNGMQAIGRNPLSKRTILTNLFQTILLSILIFAVAIFGVYLLIKL